MADRHHQPGLRGRRRRGRPPSGGGSDTSSVDAPFVDDFGTIGGEQIAPGSSTFFPSIAVNDLGDALIGFSASAPTIHPGSYLAARIVDAPAGSSGTPTILREGTDYYLRTFGGGSNRWGDYSAVALDPSDGCFWVYNQHAIGAGTPIDSEDGRWGTALGRTCTVLDDAFFDDFDDGALAGDWIYSRGDWTETGGAIRGVPDDDVGIKTKARAIADPAFGGCDLCTVDTWMMTTELVPDHTSATVHTRLLAWYVDKKTNLAVTLKPEQDKVVVRQKEEGELLIREDLEGHDLEPDVLYNVRVEFTGAAFEVYLGGELITPQPVMFSIPPSGRLGFQSRDSTAVVHRVGVGTPP